MCRGFFIRSPIEGCFGCSHVNNAATNISFLSTENYYFGNHRGLNYALPHQFFLLQKIFNITENLKKKIAPRGSERDPLRLGEGTSPRDSLGKIHSQQRGSKCKCPEVETGPACWGPIRVSGYRMCGPWRGSGAIWRWFCFSFWRGEDIHKQMLQGLSGSGERMGFRGMTWFDLHCTWTILAVITRLETGECLGGCCSW